VELIVNGNSSNGIMYAIDPATFTSVVAKSWRADYAQLSLGELINSMAEQSDQVIVSQAFADANNMRVGDRFTASADFLGSTTQMSFEVANTVRYMPTLYNEGKPFILANYDYVVDALNGKFAYEIWLRHNTTSTRTSIQSAAYANNLRMLPYTPEAFINAEILQPQRQGLFGLLSVGFIATGGMSMIGLLAYTLLALRRRSVELGVLRAIGVSQQTLRRILSIEQFVTIGFSTAIGVAIGSLTSLLYLPFLKVKDGTYPDTPPFNVHFAQTDALMIVLTASALMVGIVALELWVVQRMRIGEAVKLGEAV
jgi:putative ABC transport system permease protein